MRRDPKNVILEILNIIGYSNDKNAFAEKFINNCLLQSLSNLIARLAKEKQDSIKRSLAENHTANELAQILKKNFTAKEYSDALKTATENAFKKYLETVKPTLNQFQQKNLQVFLASL